MQDLSAIQKTLKIAKNRKVFGIDYRKDLHKLVDENPAYVLGVLDDMTDYFIHEIAEIEEANDKRSKN